MSGMPPWLRTLASVSQNDISGVRGECVQMPQVIGDLVLDELGTWGLAIVRKVEEVDHARFLLQDRSPAEVHDALQPESLMVFLPAVPDKHGVGLREGDKLELCKAIISPCGVQPTG